MSVAVSTASSIIMGASIILIVVVSMLVARILVEILVDRKESRCSAHAGYRYVVYRRHSDDEEEAFDNEFDRWR